ncbi:hypothetical protein LZ554_001732 [Drepanopeziza brunnea f. sp. 'monogermtubi']|nr:hypothetical protein LZ554_001732 [Drepanopeziza brunnea f. sp. 'monogermtubi']
MPNPIPQSKAPGEVLLDTFFENDRELTRSRVAKSTNLGIMTMLPASTMFPTPEERSVAFFDALAPTWFRAFNLVENLCSQAETDIHLRATADAVELASFSNASHLRELMTITDCPCPVKTQAQKAYKEALQLTNAALRSPSSVNKDSVLFSAMVFSIYEMITGNSRRSLDAWAEHINGAAAMVRLRGLEQFKNPPGQRMFLQVTSNLMLSCIQRAIPTPQHIIDLREEAKIFMATDSPAWRLSSIIIDFTIFGFDLKDCSILELRKVVQAALEIDQRFIDAIKDFPLEWRYYTLYTNKKPDLIWNGKYHV